MENNFKTHCKNTIKNQSTNTRHCVNVAGNHPNEQPSLRGKVTTAEAIYEPTLQDVEIQKSPFPFNLDGLLRHCRFPRNDETIQRFSAAFSLVEMLMALLVASLLMAALAPVMTKRMDEAKLNISGVGAAQYDKDALVSVFTGEEGEDTSFNLPDGVNMVKVIMVGGGGAGGNSFYGKQEVTTSKSWTVPDGVTKLRVFMLGGGGGGASGGLGTGTATIPAGGDGNTYKDFGEGAHEFTIPSTATAVPDLNPACAASGVTAWTGVSDGKDYVPGKVAVSVTACGGGGGGGGWWSSSFTGAGGGSGGYLTTAQLPSLPSSIWIEVGGGGGNGGKGCESTGGTGGYMAGGGGGGGRRSCNGGSGGIGGGAGGSGNCNGIAAKMGITPAGTILSAGGNGALNGLNHGNGAAGGDGTMSGGGGGGGGSDGCCGGGGGGGGGATSIYISSSKTADKLVFQVGGGGGGGASGGNCGGGGGGGGAGYGGGGGGFGGMLEGEGTLSSGGTFLANVIGGGKGNSSNSIIQMSYYIGGGGAGWGGVSGSAVYGGQLGANTIWKSDMYCDGGGTTPTPSQGRPGRLRLYYTYPALKCDYSLPANGSGGGGAGQIVVGEIDVTPGETLYFEIGSGGSTQSSAGKNGNAGNPTNIRRGGPTGTIIAQALGGLAGQYSSSETVVSAGGGKRNTVIVGNNWTGKTYETKGGNNGYLATAASNKGYGGAGGASMNMKGEVLQGGAGGNSAKNGVSPTTTNYGAGGGGGSGSPVIGDTTFGIGAAGAGGFIYFEYGGTNGGGGTSGEMITKLITNLKSNTAIGISIGSGGDNSTGNGNGNNTVITYDTGTSKTLTAKGGLRGNDGGAGLNEHAKEKLLPDTYSNKSDPLTKGKEGTELYGGVGGYIQDLWENDDGTYASYVKASDGKIAGPTLGGCGGNLTTLMAGIVCNDAANTPNGKNGTFGGGGGGGAVINETGGLGGRGGKGIVIIKYKAVGL